MPTNVFNIDTEISGKLTLGGTSDVVISTTGNFGIGTSTPAYKLEVNADSTSAVLSVKNAANSRDTFRSENAAGTRTFNVGNDASGHGIILVRNSSGTTTSYLAGSGNSYFNGGNVGIGTTGPSTKLEVSGVITATGGTSTNWNTAYGWGNHATAGYITGYTETQTLDDVTSLGSDTTNNISVGPSFHVGQNISTASAYLQLGNARTGNGYAYIDLVGDTTYGDYGLRILRGNGGANTWSEIVHRGTGAFAVGTNEAAGMQFKTSASVRMLINSSGNVGIGTTSPSSKLNVYTATGRNFEVDQSAANVTTLKNDYHLRLQASSGYNLQFYTGTTPSQRMLIDASGNVGIGTTSPAGKLHIQPDASSEFIFTGASTSGYATTFHMDNTGLDIGHNSTGRALNLKTGSLDRLTITGGGNVGIGTTNPSTSLEVAGDVKVTGATSGINIDTAGHASLRLDRASTSYDNNILFNTNGDTKFRIWQDGNADYLYIRDDDNATNMVTFKKGGNVGIGETNPLVPLHISRDSASGENIALLLDNNNTTAGNEIGILFRSAAGSTNTDFEIFGVANASNDMDLVFESDGSVERVRFTGDGNVGIGTTSPDSISGSVSTLSLGGTSTTISGGISYQVNGSVKFYQYVDSDGLFVHQGQSGVGQKFKVNGSEAMRINSSGNVGIGTTSPSTLLSLGNAVDAQKLLLYDNTNNFKYGFGIQSDEFRHFFPSNSAARLVIGTISTADGSTFSEKVRITSSGNVGIGTDSPGEKLHVLSSGNTVARFETSLTSDMAIELKNSQGSMFFGLGGGEEFAVATDADLNGANSKFVIKQSGDVGIGTTSPSYALDIERATGEVAIQLQARDNTSNTAIYFGDNNDADVGSLIYNHGSNYMSFTANAAERMRITSGGNVGIGVAPKTGGSTWQHIQFGGAGNIIARKSDSTVDAMFANNYYINSSNVDSHITTGAATRMFLNDGEIRFDTAPSAAADAAATFTNRMFIANGGNVGIGTTSPSEKLEVTGNAILDASNARLKIKSGVTGTNGGVDWTFDSDTTQYAKIELPYDTRGTTGLLIDSGYPMTLDYSSSRFAIQYNGSEQMRVNTSGNVGIGTASPSYKLDVYGSARIGGSNGDVDLVIEADADNSGENDNPRLVLKQDGGLVIGYVGLNGDANNAFTGAASNSMYIRNTGYPVHIVAGSTLGLTAETNGNIIMPNGNVGIGTTSPSYKLDVAGDIYISNGESLYLGSANSRISSNSSSDILYFPNRDHVFGSVISGADVERMRITEAGNVGIGTTSPVGKFHSYISAARQMGHNAVGGDLGVISDNNSSPVLYVKGTGTADLVNVLDNTTNVFTIKDGGNVGIGTTSPGRKLHVVSNGAIAEFKSTNTGTSGYAEVLYENDAGDQLIVGSIGSGYTNSAWAGARYMYATAGDLMIKTLGSGTNLRFYTAGATSERMRIDGSGNVGIGTTSPSEKLHVVGKVHIGDVNYSYGGSNYHIKLAENSNDAYISNIEGYGVLSAGGYYHGANLRMLNSTSTAYSGIQMRPDGTMHFESATGGTAGTTIGASTKMYISGAGNVGIGTTSPSEKLEVSGNILASGDITAFSDANLKENIETVPNALGKVRAMRGVTFNKIGEEKRSVGVIAQELLEVLPEAVHKSGEHYSVAYGNIVGVLIEAMKEQQAQIDELKAMINGFTK